MADEIKETEKKSKKKGRAKGPKLIVGDYPYVSLMPTARRNAIEVAEAKGKWIRVVGVGVVLAVALAAGSFGFKFMQQLAYDGAKNDAASVEESIKQYGEVDTALSIKQTIEGNIIAGTSAAINWGDLRYRIVQNLPEGSAITTFDVTVGGTARDDKTVAVFLNVSSMQPIAYAQILDSFGKVPGIVAETLLIGNLSSSDGGESGTMYSYPVSFNMDTSILSHRWDYLTNKDAQKVEEPQKKDEEPLAVPLPEETEAPAANDDSEETE